MNDSFPMFSEQAKHVLALARSRALRWGHPHLGWLHIFLGLIETPGPAKMLLESLCPSLDEARRRAEACLPPPVEKDLGETGPARDLPMAEGVVRWISVARQQRPSEAINTEAILTALCEADDDATRGLLASLRIDRGRLDEAREACMARLDPRHADPLLARIRSIREELDQIEAILRRRGHPGAP